MHDSLPSLVALATRLTKANDRQGLFDLATTHMYEIVDADRLSIAVADHDSRRFGLVGVLGEAATVASELAMTFDGTLLGAAIVQQRTIVWNLADESTDDAHLFIEAGFSTVTTAPMLSRGRCYGTINAAYKMGNESGVASNAEALTQLAELLASQLERVDALGDLEAAVARHEEHIEKLGLLHGLELRLASTTTIRQVIDILGESLHAIVAFDQASLMILDAGGSAATAYQTTGGEQGEVSTIDVDRRLRRRLFDEEAIFHEDDLDTSDDAMHRRLRNLGYRSAVSFAIQKLETTPALFTLASRATHGFSRADVALAAALASFLGTTIQRISAYEELRVQAHHDRLTGLIRREVFDGLLAEQLVASSADSALCFIDVDRFKHINDTAGHHAGDMVLQEIAQRLMAIVQPGDLLARVGGDEFVALIRGRTRESYIGVGKSLVAAVHGAPFAVDDEMLNTTISLGLAFVTPDENVAKDLISKADAACYVAKARGGNVAQVASDSDERQAERVSAAQILRDLEHAIEHDELVLYGQPIYRLSDHLVTAYEVLVRLRSPEGKIILPNAYIPVAERYGLIGALDRWVTRSALAAYERSEANGTGLKLFINISPSSLDEAFQSEIMGIVATSDVHPSSVCFELTESGTHQDFSAAVRFAEAAREVGASMALDDFGTGVSSLGHLQRLPVDYLKIDGSLLQGIASDTTSAAIVAAIQSIADALGVQTVGEQIEDAETLKALAAAGVAHAQGFFLGHPAPLARILDIPARIEATHERTHAR